MARLHAFLLVLLFAVAPAADVLCKASCAPAPAAVSSCHELAAPADDGRLDSGTPCRRDVLLAAPPGDTRRDAPAPVAVTLPASALATTTEPSPTLVHATRHVRPRATQAFPSSIVLRI